MTQESYQPLEVSDIRTPQNNGVKYLFEGHNLVPESCLVVGPEGEQVLPVEYKVGRGGAIHIAPKTNTNLPSNPSGELSS